MQISSVTTNTIESTTHQHHLGDCVLESEGGKQQDIAAASQEKDTVELSTSQVQEANEMIQEANASLLSQAISSGKDALVKFWGPSKAELEAAQNGQEEVGNLEKISPYESEQSRVSLPKKLATRAKVKIVNLATGLFHFMSGKQFQAKQEAPKKEKPKQIVIENVRVDISAEGLAESSHLLDSYDKSGAYSVLSTQTAKK